MPFLDLLSADRVRADLVAGDKDALLDQLAGLLCDGDRTVARDALRARERLGGTGLGHGVAIPHGRSAAIEHASAAFVRLATPVDFGADDGVPVDLVAALLVPAHFTDQHLKLLAELAELFSNSEITSALRNAGDAQTLLATLRGALRAAA
ncbi:MAG: PTS sugar transporter subunit IIA [Dokdonella sp.]|uniref:PTS sugar transporter subunit IIA n=1 Tax=Dokdonella sp. TaxID=2291710 RepID=UPI0025C3D40A|nr:PTS sugar transporter subunit IIA [Dokdonella sp.]MBZ0222784.1 PTS sugar transporter subunit IIA [Dokdonella sp.]MCC7255935.1 PTS sugar transporter subunit IIA [Dokdonella sp.]